MFLQAFTLPATIQIKVFKAGIRFSYIINQSLKCSELLCRRSSTLGSRLMPQHNELKVNIGRKHFGELANKRNNEHLHGLRPLTVSLSGQADLRKCMSEKSLIATAPHKCCAQYCDCCAPRRILMVCVCVLVMVVATKTHET